MTKQQDKRDDRHPSEIVRPEKWLCEPYFRHSNWIEAVTEIIEAGWRAKRRYNQKVLEQPDIEHLRYIIASFIHARVGWEGYLSKTEATELTALKSAAEKLLNRMRKLGTLDNGEEGPKTLLWYVECETSDNPTETKEALARFMKTLDNLSQMPIASPRIDKDSVQRDGRIKEPGKVASRVGNSDRRASQHNWSTIARIELQRDLDNWWKAATGLPLTKNVFKAEAFHRFLTEVYGRISLPNPPGASETAIAEARRAYRAWDATVCERFGRLSNAYADRWVRGQANPRKRKKGAPA